MEENINNILKDIEKFEDEYNSKTKRIKILGSLLGSIKEAEKYRGN